MQIPLDIFTYTAYIGPGAGFAFLGSFLALFIAVILVIIAIITWPVRLIIMTLKGRGKRTKTDTGRIIVVGLDGLDPKHCRKMMSNNQLPNFTKLAEIGAFRDLTSTCPPISPVAWSTFSTGVNPGKHNIFDFLNRDLRTIMPVLSSSRIDTHKGKSTIKLLRKSKPFWHILGEHGVFSTILRVPITFPPEKFNGLSLSAMCTPDLRGTQGSFTCYRTNRPTDGEPTGGTFITIEFQNGKATTTLPGPPSAKVSDIQLQAALTIELCKQNECVIINIAKQKIRLPIGQYSDWIKVSFRENIRQRISGICKFRLISIEPFSLYVSPINIDPAKPAMHISHPNLYAMYLAKLHGSFASLGLAEDTWALSEGVIDDDAFLEQVYDIHTERENMFFDALKRTRKGLCVCVFDASDRIQHMFMRQSKLENDTDNSVQEQNKEAIDDMYNTMDNLVGKVQSKMKKDDVLFVISDHGFTHFRRGVNLNRWLQDKGYLTMLPDKKEDDYMRGIDWTKTKAYTFGLSGIYLNIKGREAHGIVAQEDTTALKNKIINELHELTDDEHNCQAIKKAYNSDTAYSGPYKNNGPDVIVGFAEGYRASWDAAVGRTSTAVFSDNTKPWSGDHCVDRSIVPGILFTNKCINTENNINLVDIAPTILDLFGIPIPSHMDGNSIKLTSNIATQ